MHIALTTVKASDNEIRYKLDVSRPLRRYFLEDCCYAQYDGGLDLGSIDSSVLAIPMVSLVAPVAWAVGADIRVPELDATFLQSLGRVKDAYRSFGFPFSFAGDILASESVPNEFGAERTGMLFSGGVDSLTSYLRHKDEKPEFISVWGVPDIPPFEKEFWGRMWSDIRSMANRAGVPAFQVRTDILRNLNRELLNREFGLLWYGEATFGLFLLGLCAPVTAARGIGTVVIASSYTDDYRGLPGSHPLIDNKVAWADVGVVHDGYELSRQQKLRYLCRQGNIEHLSNLRVCWDSALKTNCGRCEKCMRTIAGLALEGVDPNRCNFETDESTFLLIRDRFRKGTMPLSEGQLFMWGDIQRNIPERIEAAFAGSRDFLDWLRTFDLSRYREKRLRKFLYDAPLMVCNRRTKLPSLIRKVKCYYYIALAALRPRSERPARRRRIGGGA